MEEPVGQKRVVHRKGKTRTIDMNWALDTKTKKKTRGRGGKEIFPPGATKKGRGLGGGLLQR